jgi:hypothetical protein
LKTVKIISIFGVLVMTIALLNGLINGDFLVDGGSLLQNPWGIVSMVDLYTGFILFSVWIAYREKSILRSIIWIFFMMTLGFFTGSVYMLIAAYTSQNDWKRFWMGKV